MQVKTSDIPLCTCWSGYNQKRRAITSVDECMEKLESSYAAWWEYNMVQLLRKLKILKNITQQFHS